MKECNACCRDFAQQEFQLTLMGDAGLLTRLVDEIRFLASHVRDCWPAFRSDPVRFTKARIASHLKVFHSLLKTQQSFAGTLAVLIVFGTSLFILFLGTSRKFPEPLSSPDDRSYEVTTLRLPAEKPTEKRTSKKEPSDPGIVAGSKGRVGLNKNKGEGARPEQKRSRGGGGSGDLDQSLAQKGAVPQSSLISTPITKLPAIQKQSLPAAGIDIDAALWRSIPSPVFGDPRSRSTAAANGPGRGGVIGSGDGQGVGDGTGPGFGPGQGGNTGGGPRGPGGGGGGGGDPGDGTEDPDHIFTVSAVNQRARVLLKPEPQYSEEGRRNQITGTVVLRVVFSRTGEVTNIRAVQSLPLGLTERAIAAARQIRFAPAMRAGRPVSVYMQLEYNFNLY